MKATASGIVSDMPMVSGLGPRDEPIGMDVVLNVTFAEVMLEVLSARFMEEESAGDCRPLGRGRDCRGILLREEIRVAGMPGKRGPPVGVLLLAERCFPCREGGVSEPLAANMSGVSTTKQIKHNAHVR